MRLRVPGVGTRPVALARLRRTAASTAATAAFGAVVVAAVSIAARCKESETMKRVVES